MNISQVIASPRHPSTQINNLYSQSSREIEPAAVNIANSSKHLVEQPQIVSSVLDKADDLASSNDCFMASAEKSIKAQSNVSGRRAGSVFATNGNNVLGEGDSPKK